MEFERYLELQTILQQWKTRLAESIRRRIEGHSRLLDRLQELYEADGASEEFTLWLDRWCRQAAIQFILRVLFLRVLEDRGLLGAIRIRSTDGQKMWGQITRNLGAATYVQWCCWDAAHLLSDLFGPTDYDLVLPDDDLAQRFLDEVWRRPDPNRPGWLRFDFRQDPERGDEGFQTRFIGDLYQDLDAEIRERYALLQTPHFISQFILEHTLLKRFEEKDFREVTMIDPTCGSGHFLVDAFWHFVRQFENLALKTLKRKELTPSERIKVARRVIEEHIFGCDINTYATALTRFRLALAVCDYAHPTSLTDLRDLRFNIVTIDSLIPYEKMMGIGEWTGSKTTQILGNPDDIKKALPVLKRRYEVVVGNPPYILASDTNKRELYREYYTSAYRKFGLSAPFTERFFGLAMDGGNIGIIQSNAFTTRLFGKRLIEDVLPRYDLRAIIDLSGAYIPGHGTPTLIMFGKSCAPQSDTVILLSNIKGEPGTPSNPSKGVVWQRIVNGYSKASNYIDEYIDVAIRPRSLLATHPWQFGGPKTRLYDKLKSKNQVVVSDIVDPIGFLMVIGRDEIFTIDTHVARYLKMKPKHLRTLLIGEQVRDWSAFTQDLIIYPYDENNEIVEFKKGDPYNKYFSKYETILKNRPTFTGTFETDNRVYYEYHQLTYSKLQKGFSVGFPFVATHNHVFIQRFKSLSNRSIQLIQLKDGDEKEHFLIAGIMASSIACLCLKEISYNKGGGEDPVRDRYEYSGTNVGLIPLPNELTANITNRTRLFSIVNEITELASHLPGLSSSKIFDHPTEAYAFWNKLLDSYYSPHTELQVPFATVLDLETTKELLIKLREGIRDRLIFLQEEMDWLVYEMYGIINNSPVAENYLTPSECRTVGLKLGQRAFEIAGKGYIGDWPKGYKPAPLPDYLRPLIDARVAIIENNADIGMLEDPLYKRRWIPPNYEKEFQEAAEWWLAEKLEYALEHHGKPISLRQWARLLRDDERVNAVLEVLTGTQAYDLEGELFKVIQANMVSNRSEHYLRPSGLRKYKLWQNQDENTVPPEFKSSDFSDSTAWKIRGKLNIPRERFIAYTEFDHTRKGCDAPESGGPWFGWAGWDAAKRADALAFLLEQANRAGWELHFRQCGLRAALRDLLPELEGLPEADQLEFKGLATMCGISLGTECYCQSYREGMINGEPTVPGVSEEALGVNVLRGVSNPKRATRKKDSGADQLKFNL